MHGMTDSHSLYSIYGYFRTLLEFYESLGVYGECNGTKQMNILQGNGTAICLEHDALWCHVSRLFINR